MIYQPLCTLWMYSIVMCDNKDMLNLSLKFDKHLGRWRSHQKTCYYSSLVHRHTTDLAPVPYIRVSESGQHRFRWWIVDYPAPSHYLNQSWFIVNWTIENKLQGNSNRNSYIYIHENAFETVFCEMADILSWPRSFYYCNNEYTRFT